MDDQFASVRHRIPLIFDDWEEAEVGEAAPNPFEGAETEESEPEGTEAYLECEDA